MKKFLQFFASLIGIVAFTQVSAQCPAGEGEVTIDVTTDSWGYELYFEVVPTGNGCGNGALFVGGNSAEVGCGGGAGQSAASGGYANSSTTPENIGCLAYGDYDIEAVDDWGDGGSTFDVYVDGTLLYTYTATNGNEVANGYHTFTFSVIPPPANNLSVDSAFYAYNVLFPNYSHIPQRQAKFLDPGIRVTNFGTDAQTGVTLDVTIDDGAFVVYSGSTSMADPLASGDDSTMVVDFPFVGAAQGMYNLNYEVSADLADEIPANNSASVSFTVTDTIFSRDGEDLTYALNGASYSLTGSYGFGNYFDLVEDDIASSISMALANIAGGFESTVGSTIKGYIYTWDDDATPVAETDFYTTQAADFMTTYPNQPILTLPLTSTVTLPANLYRVLIVDESGDPAGTRFSSTNDIPETAWPGLLFDAGTFYSIGNYPWVRLNTGMPTCQTLTVAETISDISCNGAADGEISLSVSGGTTPYEYTWSNGGTDADAIGLDGGDYTAIVSYMEGTEVCYTQAGPYTVAEPTALSVAGSVDSEEYCNNSNGEASAVATGGTAPYSYGWSTLETTDAIVGLSAGTYTVAVMDANGCTATNDVVISNIDNVIAVDFTVSNEDCSAANGEVTASATGGVGAYSYLWDNSDATATTSNLAAGDYIVTATDETGCAGSATATVGQDIPTIVGNLISTAENCGAADGSVTSAVSGGAAPYTYLWSNGGTDADATGLVAGDYTLTTTDMYGCTGEESATVGFNNTGIGATTSTTNATGCANADGTASISPNAGDATDYTYMWSNGGTDATAVGLTNGVYMVTISNASGCSQVYTEAVAADGAPTLTVGVTSNYNGEDISCNGAMDGEATATPSAGTPVSFSWLDANATVVATTATATNLDAAQYGVIYTDADGCVLVGEVTLTQPEVLVATATSTDVTCNGDADGTASVSTLGGTGAVTFLWSDASTDAALTGLSASVDVTATDANGCEATASAVVVEPAVLSASATATDAVCNGGNGSVATTVAGGTGAYSYLWSNTETTDGVSAPASSLDVTVTDANGCEAIASATIAEPTVLAATATATDADCNAGTQGTADVTATGGTGAYSYLWSNTATDASLSGLGAGTYDVTVSDVNGCEATASATVAEPSALSATATATDVTCNGAADGSIAVVATGGTTDYSYAWSNGSTDASISSLGAGTLTVTVTDANGCSATDSDVVNEASALTLNITVTNNSGGTTSPNGTLTAVPGGGSSGYTYLWSNGATTATITGLVENVMQTVTVTDSQGCSAFYSMDVQVSSVHDVTSSTDMVVYPNPTSGMFNVRFVNAESGYYTLTVRNIIGQTVVNEMVSVNSNTIKSINLENVDKGVYFLTINNESIEKTVRVIVK